jgi:hypothetical protein
VFRNGSTVAPGPDLAPGRLFNTFSFFRTKMPKNANCRYLLAFGVYKAILFFPERLWKKQSA